MLSAERTAALSASLPRPKSPRGYRHLHVAFAVTRVHRLGELGNAILSRWPITSLFVLDLSFSSLERRSGHCQSKSA
jgi:hypothetical protein